MASEFRAVSAHFVYERGNRVRPRARRNAVAEIENVSGRRAETVQHAPRLFAHARIGRSEHGWIEISLHRDLRAHAPARVARIDGPIEAHGAPTARRNRFQPGAAAFGA